MAKAIWFWGFLGFLFFGPANGQGLQKAQAVVVLGAAQFNGQPGPILRQRLLAAANLYQRGFAPIIVTTGGKAQGDRYSEGEVGQQFLIRLGIPAQAIRSEVQSRSTYQNLLLALPLLPGKRVILVTDQPHLPRALLLAQGLGLQAQGYAVTGNFSSQYRSREAWLLLLTRLGLKD